MKVWLAVLLAALVRGGSCRTSIVDTLIRRSDAPESELDNHLLNLLGKDLFGNNFVPSNEIIFKDRIQSPYDIDVNKSIAARAFGGFKLNAVRFNINKRVAPGLKGKLKGLKGGFKKLHKNKVTARAKAGWKKIKEKYDKIPDKSRIIKEILKEAWNILGNFELREIIYAALEEMGFIPECSCYLNDKEFKFMEFLKVVGQESEFQGSLVRCGCCIKPFGWKSLCMMVKTNVTDLTFEVTLEFDDKEFLALPIKFKKGSNGVAPPKSSCVPEHRLVVGQERCAYIGDIPFIDICLRPREIEVHEEYGRILYVGTCVQIVVDFLYYTYEKCFQFDVDQRRLSVIDDEDY